jgi:hypothetical protein
MAKVNKNLKRAVKKAKEFYEDNPKLAESPLKDEWVRGINETLKERDSSYGEYSEMADCIQQLKSVVNEFLDRGRGIIDPALKESLDMICTKIGRIVVGDSHHIDSWHDISGYATLAEKYIKNIKSNNEE